MSTFSGIRSRNMSHPDLIDKSLDAFQNTTQRDDSRTKAKHGHSQPVEIPAIQRVRSSENMCNSMEKVLVHQMSATMAFAQNMPLARRSASYPSEDAFGLRKSREQGNSSLAWPERDEDSFSRGSKMLLKLEFDAASFSQDVLMHLVLEIFVRQRLDERLNISRNNLRRFISSVRFHMLENTYHNFTHVADVVQSVYALGTRSGLLARLSDLETVAIFTAALCHDLEHPGVSNIVVIKANPSLSSMYGEASSLEKHHSLRALSLMMHAEVELLSGLDAAAYHNLRDMITRIILATDMSRHADYLARLAQMNAALPDSPRDTQLEMEILIKAADTSNVLRPMAVAKKWAVSITDEFFAQGDMEASLGLEISHQCDRRLRSRVDLQKGFIDFVITPFYAQLAEAYPSLSDSLSQVHRNRQQWELHTDDQLLADVRRCGGLVGSHPPAK